MEHKNTLEDLRDRVIKFNRLELRGQPQESHMGTFRLVNDLWVKVKRLEEALVEAQFDFLSRPPIEGVIRECDRVLPLWAEKTKQYKWHKLTKKICAYALDLEARLKELGKVLPTRHD